MSLTVRILFLLTLGVLVVKVTSVNNEFGQCWSKCRKRNGWCSSHCGSGGLCCRQGYSGNGCDGSLGGKEHHVCTSDERGKAMRYRGKDCWGSYGGGCSNGKCNWCGPKGYCCRVKWTGGGCDGKMGGDSQHLCTPVMINDGKKWMSRVSGEKYLSQITIPGTHDSCADHNSNCGTFKKWYECQDKTVTEQLNLGVRFLDIRFKHKNDKFMINHGGCYLRYTFDGVMQTLKDFLTANNQETVMVSYSYYPNQDEDNTRSFQETLDEYINQSIGLFYQGEEVPKLKDVRGKIVLLNFGKHGRTSGKHGLYEKWNDSTVANRYELKDEVIWYGYGRYIESLRKNMRNSQSSQNPQLLYLTYTSASGGLWPKTVANNVNKHIHNWCLQQDASKNSAGVVIWDYIRDYHATVVYNINF